MACGPAPHRLYETEPSLVIDVLSPSTSDRDRDRRDKAVAYAQCRSLQLLVLVGPNIPRAEVARPVEGAIGDWAVFGTSDAVASSYGDVDIDARYDAIDRTATTA